jgi:glutathionylspermidine synthase
VPSPTGTDAGADTATQVTASWARLQLSAGTIVHFFHDRVAEEEYHSLYMIACASKAGVTGKRVVCTDGLTFGADGAVYDADGVRITHVWKTYA